MCRLVGGDRHRVTLVDCFTTLRVKSFPAHARWFVVAALTSRLGEVNIDIAVDHLATGDRVYHREATMRFHDRVRISRIIFPLHACEFPEPGAYHVIMTSEGEWVAQQRLEVRLLEENS